MVRQLRLHHAPVHLLRLNISSALLQGAEVLLLCHIMCGMYSAAATQQLKLLKLCRQP